MNLPELTDVLEETEFFERERTDHHVVELAILLYNFWVSFRKVARELGWIGVERTDVAVWNWVQKIGHRLSGAGRRRATDRPAVLLMDETVVTQWGKNSCCLQLSTRRLGISSTPQSRNQGIISPQRFLTDIAELYGRAPAIVVTDEASYGSVFTNHGVTQIVRCHSIRNRIEHWIQERFAASIHSTPPSPATTSKPRTTGLAVRLGLKRLPNLAVPRRR